jgi:8-oxo-dGTP pyrophosphatase MutT (NUDIX family)
VRFARCYVATRRPATVPTPTAGSETVTPVTDRRLRVTTRHAEDIHVHCFDERLRNVAVKRTCSKVLLVDEENRVLLFSGIDRTKPDVPAWWFPVGGALEPGETLAEAAIRETEEETGLKIADPGPIVFRRSFRWDFEGEEYDQEESFFLVRVDSFLPESNAWTDTEAATIRGTRWWAIEELRSTDEAVFPEDIADQLERLLHP